MAKTNATQPPHDAAPIAALLRRERKRFSTYWTLMQEMRIRGELPEWVRKGFPTVGQHEDWDANVVDQHATDAAVLGEPQPRKYSLGLDNRSEAFLHSQEGHLLFQGKPSDLAASFPDALFEFSRSQLQMYVNALRCESMGTEVAYG